MDNEASNLGTTGRPAQVPGIPILNWELSITGINISNLNKYVSKQ